MILQGAKKVKKIRDNGGNVVYRVINQSNQLVYPDPGFAGKAAGANSIQFFPTAILSGANRLYLCGYNIPNLTGKEFFPSFLSGPNYQCMRMWAQGQAYPPYVNKGWSLDVKSHAPYAWAVWFSAYYSPSNPYFSVSSYINLGTTANGMLKTAYSNMAATAGLGLWYNGSSPIALPETTLVFQRCTNEEY